MIYFKLPLDHISRVVDICPICQNTKTVSTPIQAIKLSIDPEYRTECSECQIYWHSKRKNFNG